MKKMNLLIFSISFALNNANNEVQQPTFSSLPIDDWREISTDYTLKSENIVVPRSGQLISTYQISIYALIQSLGFN